MSSAKYTKILQTDLNYMQSLPWSIGTFKKKKKKKQYWPYKRSFR